MKVRGHGEAQPPKREIFLQNWGPDMGVEVPNVWGEENVPKRGALPKISGPFQRASGLLSRGFLYKKNRATPIGGEGGGKRTVRGGGPKPLFGRGVLREAFLPPPFMAYPEREPMSQLFRESPWNYLRSGRGAAGKCTGPTQWSKIVKMTILANGDLIPNWILAFVAPDFGPKKSMLVHLGPPTVLWPLLIVPRFLETSF